MGTTNIHSFEKGVHKNNNPLTQAKGTLRNVKNGVHVSDQGDFYALTNERGAEEIVPGFPAGFYIVGNAVLDNDKVVVLANPTNGASQIGTLSGGVYTRAIPGIDDPSPDTNIQLGFTIENSVDCQARKILSGDRILYFTDDNVPFGAVNLDDPPPYTDIKDNVKLIPDRLVPNINFTNMEETAGSLHPGVYQFASRYRTDVQNATTFGIPSNVIPVVDDSRSGGRDKFDGSYPDDAVVNKTIVLDVSNVDQSFPFIEPVVIFYEGIDNSIKIYSLGLFPISGDSISIRYSGDNTGLEEITLEELRQESISYSLAKCIEQKDNRLFLSNLEDENTRFEEELQQLANSITVKYKIKEIDLSIETTSQAVFDIEGIPYADAVVNADAVFFEFNQPITSPDPAIFTLVEPGDFATGSVTVTSYATIVVGDTITIGADVFTEGVEWTAATSNLATAISIAAAIDLHASYDSVDDGVDTADITYSTRGTVGNKTIVFGTGTGMTKVNLAGGVDDIPYLAASVSVLEPNQLEVDFSPQAVSVGWEIIVAASVENAAQTATYDSGGSGLLINSEAPSGSFVAITEETGFVDYKNEALTFYEKGLRRGENYSFSFDALYSDGASSFSYHICGNDVTTPTTTDAARTLSLGGLGYEGNTEGDLGTYVSTLTYPANQNYPGSLAGYETPIAAKGVNVLNEDIRHHRMPELTLEPHIRRSGSSTIIRVLYVEFKFNTALSVDLQSAIQGFSFNRERRNTSQNKTVVSQGLVNHHVETSNNYDGDVSGAAVAGSEVYKKRGLFSNANLAVKYDPVAAGPGLTDGGFSIGTPEDKHLAFDSPDYVLGRLTADEVGQLKIKRTISLRGTASSDEDNIYANRPSQASIGIFGEYRLSNFPALGYYCTLDTEEIPVGSFDTDILESANVEQSKVEVDNLSYPIDNTKSSSYLYLETAATVDIGSLSSADYTMFHVAGSSGFNHFNPDIMPPSQFDVRYHLYSIEADNTTQYGNVYNSEFINMEKFDVVPTSGSTFDVFGGDTFISRFSYTNKNIWFMRSLKGVSVPTIGITRTSRSNSYGSGEFTKGADGVFDGLVNSPSTPPGGADNSESMAGMDVRSLISTWFESDVNCEYRHESGNIEYHLRSDITDTTQQDPRAGDSRSYNTQYSFENTVKTNFTRGISAAETNLGSFENRTIYSLEAKEDDLEDNYRNFLVNNFNDLPKNTGEIWDTQVHNNILYSHTPKSLWRDFVNDVTAQASSISDVVLGTGGLYSLKSKEVFTTEGGYAGSISQYGGVSTPFGYIFPDVLQGKWFMLSDTLTDISAIGMSQYFDNLMDTGLITTGVQPYIDNPYNPNSAGITSGWDAELQRLILSKRGTAEDFNWSFDPLRKVWISEHDYSPNSMVQFNNEIYAFDNSGTTVRYFQHNRGDYGVYYDGTPNTFEIDLIINDHADMEKVFDNLEIVSVSYDGVNFLEFETFKQIECDNDYQNSGLLNINTTNDFDPTVTNNEVLCRWKKNQFQVALPRDDQENNYNTNNYFEASRLKSKWLRVRLSYDNLNNYKLTCNFIKSTIRPIAR